MLRDPPILPRSALCPIWPELDVQPGARVINGIFRIGFRRVAEGRRNLDLALQGTLGLRDSGADVFARLQLSLIDDMGLSKAACNQIIDCRWNTPPTHLLGVVAGITAVMNQECLQRNRLYDRTQMSAHPDCSSQRMGSGKTGTGDWI